MSQKLFEKYFPQDEERESQRVKEQWEGTVALLATLVAAPGWNELKNRLEVLVKRADIKPGAEGQMLYQIGLKDGIKQVHELFLSIENELRREYSSRS